MLGINESIAISYTTTTALLRIVIYLGTIEFKWASLSPRVIENNMV